MPNKGGQMSDHTFEIGLVGAGAISAGAYTGGVVDFLVHALDQWYAAKDNDGQAPPHDVKISVLSGASAGAMSAALATAYLGSDQPSVTSEDDGLFNNGKNKLYHSWVDGIDIEKLLETHDLAGRDSKVHSLLDSSVLEQIAEDGLKVTARSKRRHYVAQNLELLLTVTNLRGVPYAFELIGETSTGYDMSLHADYVHFRINDSGQDGLPDRYTMSWNEFGASSPVRDKLQAAALASGAFPVGLAPRNLNHVIPGNGKPDWYSSREWPIPTPYSREPHRCVTQECIPVSWGGLQPDYRFDFQCVDGGVMNNEPLELARRLLAGPAARNERRGEFAEKALLLIDPFPSSTSFDPDYATAPDLIKTAIALFGALKNQARFKPDELMLAAHRDVYSRFMIAPSRDGEKYPIASAALGGFGGFLKREFRSHDYFLGRRNAQKFLRDHFVLPENNPLFGRWNEEQKNSYCVREASGVAKRKDGQRLLPIIPLVGPEANAPCYQAKWPQYSADNLDLLARQIEGRADVVFDRLVDQYFKSNNLFVRFIARLIIGRKKRDVVRFARDKVVADLKKMGLMGQ